MEHTLDPKTLIHDIKKHLYMTYIYKIPLIYKITTGKYIFYLCCNVFIKIQKKKQQLKTNILSLLNENKCCAFKCVSHCLTVCLSMSLGLS